MFYNKTARIPRLAKTGIQRFSGLKNFLDPGFHRGGDPIQIFPHLRGGTMWE